MQSPRLRIDDKVTTTPNVSSAPRVYAKVIDYFDGKDDASTPELACATRDPRILILLTHDGQKIFRREEDCILDDTPDVPRII